MVLWSDPSADAVALPSGTETKDQQVPEQLTRLPTTVDHSTSTGAPAVRPEAETSTFVFTVPAVDDRCAVAEPVAASPVAAIVVRASTVGATLTGQSSWALRPARVLRDRERELLELGRPRQR